MGEQLGTPPGGTAVNKGFDYIAALGFLIAALLALYLIWWMPARVAAGYVMPNVEGSVATLPQELPVIWIRSWPWQGSPPDVTITFLLPADKKVTAAASVTATPGFYARAVPATLHLSRVPAIAPTEILGIDLTWQGGSSSAVESDLWVTARPSDTKATGARTVWAPELSTGARPAVELQLSQHPEVVSISSPAPVTSPWINARCLPDTKGAKVAAQLLQGHLTAKPTACSRLGGASAAIVTPPLPGGYTFFVWQPALEELVNTHLTTVIVGKPLVATGQTLTSSNWWQFAAGDLTPGF